MRFNDIIDADYEQAQKLALEIAQRRHEIEEENKVEEIIIA